MRKKSNAWASVLKRLCAFDAAELCNLDGLMAGVDEVGRGPLAGPVVAAAVILLGDTPLPYLNDSKKISPERRETLFQQIAQSAIIGIGVVDHKEIDRINIYQASRLAMKKAILDLPRTPDHILIDGNMKLDLPISQKAVVGGDAKSASIAAASIVAKVHRDKVMAEMHRQFPAYGFDRHKGYGTRFHLERLRETGPCEIHRRSFISEEALNIIAQEISLETALES